MIYSRLMHVHVSRTGGFALKEILGQIEGLETWEISYHKNYDTLVKWCKDNGRPVPPAITFARNPWSWYPAMWSWLRMCRDEYWYTVGDPFPGDFMDYLKIVYRGKRPGEELFKPFTWHWHRVLADKAQYFGQMENFRRDLTRILVDIMPDLVTAEQIGHIIGDQGLHSPDLHFRHNGQQRNLSPYCQYYSDEAIEWVFEMDRTLIERFKYDF